MGERASCRGRALAQPNNGVRNPHALTSIPDHPNGAGQLDAIANRRNSEPCAGPFSDAGMMISPRAPAAGVRKAPRHEIAEGGGTPAVPRALWGLAAGRDWNAGPFATAIRLEWEHNLGVTARVIAKWGIHVFVSRSCGKKSTLSKFCAEQARIVNLGPARQAPGQLPVTPC